MGKAKRSVSGGRNETSITKLSSSSSPSRPSPPSVSNDAVVTTQQLPPDITSITSKPSLVVRKCFSTYEEAIWCFFFVLCPVLLTQTLGAFSLWQTELSIGMSTFYLLRVFTLSWFLKFLRTSVTSTTISWGFRFMRMSIPITVLPLLIYVPFIIGFFLMVLLHDVLSIIAFVVLLFVHLLGVWMRAYVMVSPIESLIQLDGRRTHRFNVIIITSIICAWLETSWIPLQLLYLTPGLDFEVLPWLFTSVTILVSLITVSFYWTRSIRLQYIVETHSDVVDWKENSVDEIAENISDDLSKVAVVQLIDILVKDQTTNIVLQAFFCLIFILVFLLWRLIWYSQLSIGVSILFPLNALGYLLKERVSLRKYLTILRKKSM